MKAMRVAAAQLSSARIRQSHNVLRRIRTGINLCTCPAPASTAAIRMALPKSQQSHCAFEWTLAGHIRNCGSRSTWADSGPCYRTLSLHTGVRAANKVSVARSCPDIVEGVEESSCHGDGTTRDWARSH